MLYRLWAAALLGCIFAGSLPAADEAPGARSPAARAPAEDPATALRKLKAAGGLQVDLFAAEPDVQNPVAISIDEQGRVFVVESFRRRSSVFDIRGHKEWLDDDFSFRTVRERAEFLRREVSPANPATIKRLTGGGRGSFGDFNRDGVIDWRDLEVQTERIRLLVDTNNDGHADQVSVFADGFTNLVSGVAAGVLARRGEVYFACIPDLWRLRDTRDGRPAERTPLLNGFGVHIAFGGHDMHGLIFGPDGKLYWSIADRGTDTNLFSKIKNPIPGFTPELLADSGCIFRANPDGSDFEIIAWGLRNPQELAFDESGNLFTADNNGDGGDPARWHHVVEGADFGWRIGWQWLPKMGAWNSERIWACAPSNHNAWVLPPLAHIGHGPAGLACNPGTGLPPQFDRHFFLCNFPGNVLAWTNIPDGASFRAGPVTKFLEDLGPTDIEFHPDGGVLVSDWTKTFEKTDKGRLYRVHDPATDASPLVQETKRLLAGGIEGSVRRMINAYAASTNLTVREQMELSERLADEAAKLFEHVDFRVRLEAQYQFARADGRHWNPFLAFILRRNPHSSLHRGTNSELACIHALWASAARMATEAARHPMSAQGGRETSMTFLAEDSSAKVRFHYANLVGQCGDMDPTFNKLLPLLRDNSPRVRLASAMALGKWAERTRLRWGGDAINSFRTAQESNRCTTALFELLRADGQNDGYLRHAAVLALARIGDTEALLGAVTNPSRSVRLGVLLALRRLGSPEVARFLTDPDPQIILEAARAINDVPIEAAMPRLSMLLISPPPAISNLKSEITAFTLRRALNANFRLGQTTNAQALATFSGQTNAPESLRVEALELLAGWPKPPPRDRIMGLHRPLPPRETAPAADALRAVLALLLKDAPKAVKLAATRAAAALSVKEADLFALLADPQQSPEVRVEALQSLAAGKDPRLTEALQIARADRSEALRIAATKFQGGATDAAQLARILETGSMAEKQNALAALASATGEAADTLIAEQVDALLAETLSKELILDVLEAAETRAGLKPKLAAYAARFPESDALAPYRPSLFGGNAANGRKIFIENQQIACFRCHKINGEGGEVGPDLTGLGARQSREYLLEAIVLPNKQVAAGYESVSLTLKNGARVDGQLKRETPAELAILTGEDGLVTVKVADIQQRDRGLSAMPEELVAVIPKSELRDLVEFLATLK